ncbi:MAG: DUF4352 domain-containing protein [Erysipelotrichales bacterium]|nr:DUF4352 domain-containing protein [Erysipelotrichales bacterium]
MREFKSIFVLIVMLCISVVGIGCESKEERMQQIFDSAKQSIENNDYVVAFSNYSKLKDTYKNEQLSTELYNFAIQEIEKNIDPMISEKRYSDAISALQGIANDVEPVRVYCYGKVTELTKLKDSEIAYQNAKNLYSKKKYIEAFYEYKKILSESEYYEKAQEVMTELSDKLFSQYLSQAKKAYSKKDYIKAVENINIAVDLKPQDENASKLQLSYKKAKAEYDEKEQAKAEAAAIKSKMATYEFGTGNIGIGCHVKVSRTFDGGYTTYTAAKDHIFLWVDVGAYNTGSSTEHVNPNDFTLSTPDGYTVNPDTETTYSLSNYFDAINLPPNGKSQGWLIFHVPKSSKYRLNYKGFNSSTTKELTTE